MVLCTYGSSNNANKYNANNYPEAKMSRRYMILFDKAEMIKISII